MRVPAPNRDADRMPFGANALCQALDPDHSTAVRDSLRLDSTMESGAFKHMLRALVRRTPLLSVVHVPPELLAAWWYSAQQPEQRPKRRKLREGGGGNSSKTVGGNTEGDRARDEPMHAWFEEHRATLLSATYVAFHWAQDHYCSLVLNLDVWRKGPPVAAAASSHARQSSPATAYSSVYTRFRSSTSIRSRRRVAFSATAIRLRTALCCCGCVASSTTCAARRGRRTMPPFGTRMYTRVGRLRKATSGRAATIYCALGSTCWKQVGRPRRKVSTRHVHSWRGWRSPILCVKHRRSISLATMEATSR